MAGPSESGYNNNNNSNLRSESFECESNFEWADPPGGIR